MIDTPGDVLKLTEHPDYERAVPTPDHFIPVIHIAALAASSGEVPGVLVDGYALGSLSMTCFTIGATCDQPSEETADAGSVPNPSLAPPDQSNM